MIRGSEIICFDTHRADSRESPLPETAAVPSAGAFKAFMLNQEQKVRAKNFYCVQLELRAETKGTCTFQDSAARASALELHKTYVLSLLALATKTITMTNSLQLMRSDKIAAVAVSQRTLTLSFVIGRLMGFPQFRWSV